jgi:hypothetical protein
VERMRSGLRLEQCRQRRDGRKSDTKGLELPVVCPSTGSRVEYPAVGSCGEGWGGEAACPALLTHVWPPQYQRHLFVHISQHCPSPGAPPLESVDVRQIYDKFPEKKGGLRELYDRGPPHAFFLVKFWVSSGSKPESARKSRVLARPLTVSKPPGGPRP